MELQRRDGGFELDMQQFPWGSDYFRQHGQLMPDDGVARLRMFDAILFGDLVNGGTARVEAPETTGPEQHLRLVTKPAGGSPPAPGTPAAPEESPPAGDPPQTDSTWPSGTA